MENWKKTFKKYVSKYDMNDIGIKRKYEHSLRVMDYCTLLAKDYGLTKEEINIVGLVGLLHDYGRFYQWEKYHTYSDLKSIDHADSGVKYLFDNNEIENYNIDKKYYDIIYKAIKYHNKISLPEDLSEKEKTICNIIRDADKIDIFYLVSIDKTLLKEDNENISKNVKESFFNHKLVDRLDVKSYNDDVVVNFAMLFDINFLSSYEIIKDKKVLDNMYDILDNKDRFKECYEECIKFLNNKLNESIFISVNKTKKPYIKKLTNDNIINLTGQSGSGKSTYAKNNYNNDNYLVVDTDDIFSEDRFNNASGVNKELGIYFREKYKNLPILSEDFDLIYEEIINYLKDRNKTIVIDCAVFHYMKDISKLKGIVIVMRTDIDTCYKRAIERWQASHNSYSLYEISCYMDKKKGIYTWYKDTNKFLEKIDKIDN